MNFHIVIWGASMLLHRRSVLLLSACGLIAPPLLADTAPVGVLLDVKGTANLARGGAALVAKAADALMVGDQLTTASASLAAIELFTSTKINLGPETQFLIDQFAADLGGTITVGGAMGFDRADDLPKLDLTVQNAFAQIGVRGTRFFAGPSKGVYGIFVARGSVEVRAAGEVRRLGPGDGVDIASPGAAPSAVAQWKAPRIKAAFESVGLTV
jgi:ferric-dicitrate binding protein FerR (iron transport regulator)